jgi:Flp pilus assembly protein TadD
MKRFLALGAAALLLAAGPGAGKDVYKAFLSPEVPHHRAIREILAQIEINPKDASLFNDLGCLVAWDGFWRDALRNFETAAKLDPGDTRPLFNAGIVYAYKGEWGNARSAFQQAVKRGPGNWAGWWMLGYAEEQLGNTQSAIDAYKTSLRTDTSLFDVKTNPFAANSRLKAMVLTATYDKRLARAAMPQAEEFSNADRIGALLQPSKVVPRSAATAAGEPEAPSATGPVITNVPAAASSAPARTGSVAPAPPRPYRPPFTPGGEPASATGAAPADGTARRIPGPGGFEPATTSPGAPAAAPHTAPGAPQTAPAAPPPATTSVVPGPGAGA